MTYNVLSGMLSLYTSTIVSLKLVWFLVCQ